MTYARSLLLVLVLGSLEACSNGRSAEKAAADDVAVEDAIAVDDVAATADEGAAEDVPEPAPDVAPDPGVTFPPAPDALGGDRPAAFFLPDDYDPAKAWPLVILLHGYSANGSVQNAYLGIGARATEDGFILVVPEGTKNSQGQQFWNATNACCNFEGSAVDDVAYLHGLMVEAATFFNVDTARVYFMGHSNGGFMSYRMACEHGDEIAAVVSLAGATWLNEAKCPGTAAVSVLQVHGTKDETILYGGDTYYPSAPKTVSRWVARDGCDDEPTAGDAMDLIPSLAGAETSVKRWGGCASGTAVELWTLEDGTHIPFFNGDFAKNALGFLLSKSRE